MRPPKNTPSPPTARVLAVLETLAEATDVGLSLSEVARALKLNISTTAAILATLDQAGYVERLPNRAYQLGSGLFGLLAGLRSRYPLLGAADDELNRLSATTTCAASLARISADDTEVILTVGTVQEFETPIGHRMPLYPPYGSVAIAWRDPDSIDEWLTTAPEPLSRKQILELRTIVAEIRHRGYAVYSLTQDVQTVVSQIRDLLSQVDDHAPADALRRLLLNSAIGAKIYTDAELGQPRNRSVGYLIAPVFGPDQQPRYLVTLHVMRETVPTENLDRYAAALLQAAATLTAAQGGQWPAGKV
ncbi:IclR family transcriptional regulator [[Mycobacterium] vasticus]|uniref:Helix-turn-helix domain-containing protein n=1 Tax=[Mycobacterium] vasticus TaxID=2875777 RepID=A0ABU5YVT2_9MYCO|nr:helix-turn-helix domain-containing protein [Mycolicibacter sp. MYC017]MEB3069219.1 helix-turn-helix domain-containing protein [Mycolicibacter sp. MYC017]